jgi:hypothetical protein
MPLKLNLAGHLDLAGFYFSKSPANDTKSVINDKTKKFKTVLIEKNNAQRGIKIPI